VQDVAMAASLPAASKLRLEANVQHAESGHFDTLLVAKSRPLIRLLQVGDGSINQPINQSSNQSINQSINQPIN
jgi:hypothetical protein